MVLLVWFNGLGCLCSGFLGCFVGVLFVVVGLVWLGEVFVTYLVGCWRVLGPPPLGRNLHCGWRIRSRAVVVSQQGISLLEGRCVR